jgi:outer membrane lipoprotein-sorting protein
MIASLKRGTAAMAVICSLTIAAGAAEDLESVEKTIADLTDKVVSYTAKIDMVSEKPMKTHGTGTLACLKKDDAFLYRMELVNKTEKGKLEQKVLGVFDGTDLYSQTDMAGKPVVMKMKPDLKTGVVAFSGKGMFEQMHKNFDVTLLPDEVIGGKPAYAIEAVAKNAPADDIVARTVFHFSKEHGVQVKEITYDKSGLPLMTLEYKDMNFDPHLDASQFNYTPPPDARVLNGADLKKMLQQKE